MKKIIYLPPCGIKQGTTIWQSAKSFSTLILPVMMICFTSLAKAQVVPANKIIEGANWQVNQLTPGQLQQYNLLVQSDVYSNIYPINFASLLQTQQNARVKLDVPGDDCGDLVFFANTVEYNNENDYYWSGRVENNDTCYCYEGDIILFKRNGTFMGTITSGDIAYDLKDLGDGKAVVAKINSQAMTKAECTHQHEYAESESDVLDRSLGNCDIRVYFLYNRTALNVVGSVPALTTMAQLGLQQANQALFNSRVNQDELKFRFVGIDSLNFTQTSLINMTPDLEGYLASTTLAPIINSRRIANSADIIMFLTGNTYTDQAGSVRMGFQIDTLTNGFAIAGVQYAVARYTIAHELGHLFDGRHENDNSAPDVRQQGHVFNIGCWPNRKERRTMMATGAPPKRILHYSDPNVYYERKRTGHVDNSHVTLFLRSNACTVANYVTTGNEPLIATISGPTFGCAWQTVTLNAGTSGGVPGSTYSFEWSTSEDGVNYSIAPNQTNATFGFYLALNGTGARFAKVKITEAPSGASSTAWVIVIVQTGPPCGNFQGETGGDRAMNGGQQSKFHVSPHPAEDFINISFDMPQEAEALFTIRDMNGREVLAHHTGRYLPGTQNIWLDISRLPSGMYGLSFFDSNTWQTRKLIITKHP